MYYSNDVMYEIPFILRSNTSVFITVTNSHNILGVEHKENAHVFLMSFNHLKRVSVKTIYPLFVISFEYHVSYLLYHVVGIYLLIVQSNLSFSKQILW